MAFNVTILGSSSALPTSKRFLTAHLVNHDERFFLIDCGEGTQIQLRRLKTKFSKINNIFISHLHGDHVFGLFGLLSSLSMLGRKSIMHIYAHEKLKEILDVHFKLFNERIAYHIEYHFINPKKVETLYADSKFEVIAFPLKHRIPCSGFVFRDKPKEPNIRKECISSLDLGIKDILSIKAGNDFIDTSGMLHKNENLTTPPPPPRSYAFCTDTRYTESVIEHISQVNVLYHEATFLDEDQKLAKATYHSTTVQAAQMALLAGAEKLVIGHFSSRYKNDDTFLTQAQVVFPNTLMAEEGLRFEI